MKWETEEVFDEGRFRRIYSLENPDMTIAYLPQDIGDFDLTAFPDLLEACEAVLKQVGGDPCEFDHHGYCQTHNGAKGDWCWYFKVDLAIRKAKGKL